MQSLNEIFDHARDYGHPEAQAIVKAWDRETDTDPMTVIERAESDDLKEELKEYYELTGKLEDQVDKLKYALVEMRYRALGAARRFSCDFSESYDFYQESAAREVAEKYAPDLDVSCAYVLIEDGDLEEVWGSRSFSSTATFQRIY